MNATYISANSFSVSNDRTLEFVTGRRVKCDCGVNGIVYADVVSATYSVVTTVVIDENSLTSNLVTVLYGVVEPGPTGSLPNHDHSTTEGMGSDGVSLLYLSDTPTTYSGTEGAMLVSTGSGTTFTHEGVWLSGTNAPNWEGEIGNYYIDTTTEIIYKKNREHADIVALSAKSVILEVANNWGQTQYSRLRSVEFKRDGVLIDLLTADFTTYASSYHWGYPSQYDPNFLFDTSKSKIDSSTYTEWSTAQNDRLNQWVTVVFDEVIWFDEVVVNNSHLNGGVNSLIYGSKDAKLIISSDEITTHVYGDPISNSETVFTGQFTIHPAVNAVADQVLDIDDALALEDLDTGWDAVITVRKNLIELDDTPSTYSGTEGAMLVSTGSGTEFTQEGRWLGGDGAPTRFLGNLGNYYLDETGGGVYERARIPITPSGIIAKSLVFEGADTWGATTEMGCRSIEFKLDGTLLPLVYTDFTANQSDAYDASYYARHVFDTTLSKTGTHASTSWQTYGAGTNVNQWMTVAFDTEIEFDEIIVNNFHATGGLINRGMKNTKIYISSDEITTHVYGDPISNSTLIFDGTFLEHVASDTIDDKDVDITTAVSTITGVALLDTCWDMVLLSATAASILDLTDTPTTYSGTDGAMLVSTGSGTEFTQEGRWLGGGSIPPTVDLGIKGNYYLDEVAEIVYKKNRDIIIPAFFTKSIVFEFADNWGHNSRMGCTSIEFKLNGVLSELVGDDYDSNASSTGYDHGFLFDTTLSKIGNAGATSWRTGIITDISNQWVTVVFDDVLEFDEIVVNNYHSVGIPGEYGVKNTKIYITPDSITSHTYGDPISNSTEIFDGVIAEHVASNVVDDQVLDVSEALLGQADNTGWDRVLLSASSASILDLTDTPTTYSGAEGKYLRATALGTEWNNISDWFFGSGEPTQLIPAGTIFGDLYYDDLTGDLYEKTPSDTESLQLWYAGNDSTNWRIMYATSTNGTTWTKQGTVLDLGAGGEDDDVSAYVPYVLKESDIFYKMWYAGNDGANIRIMYATSTNGTTWTKQGTVLDIGTGGDDDDLQARSPYVLKESDIFYKMWYTGNDGANTRIMYATSTNGTTWTKQGTVLDVGAGGEDDGIGVLLSFIIKESDILYKMWYSGNDGANTRIMYATSTNGTTWTKQGTVLDVGAGGEDDDLHAHGPYVFKESDIFYKMWYSGHDGANIRIMYATSTNGTTWTKQGTVLDIGTGGDDDDRHTHSPSVTINNNAWNVKSNLWPLGYPSTYSGTEGAMLVSTGSGTEFTHEGRWYTGSGDPYPIQPANFGGLDSFYFNVEDNSVWQQGQDTPFSGGTVTVGASGRDYTTINAAISAANDGDVILIDPGTYNEAVAVNKHVHLKGRTTDLDTNSVTIYNTAASPGRTIDITVGSSTTFCNGIKAIYIEGVYSYHTYDWRVSINMEGVTTDLKLLLNRCQFGNGATYAYPVAGWDAVTSGADLRIINCKLVRGYAHAVRIDFPCSVEKTELNNSWSCYNCPEVPDPLDYVTTTTSGYGYDYGDWYIDQPGTPATITEYAPFSEGKWRTMGGIHGGTLLALPDTPSTYSGTEGAMLVSTGSGTEFTYEGIWLSGNGTPLVSEGKIGNYYADEDGLVAYKKNRFVDTSTLVAKSVIFEFADNWGSTSMGIRSIEFKLDGELIAVSNTNSTTYNSTRRHSNFAGYRAFNTTYSKIGTSTETAWQSLLGSTSTNQWLSIVFDFGITIEFDELVINNSHGSGDSTIVGVKNTKIYTSSDEITTHTYGDPISNSLKIADIQVAEHIPVNSIDDQDINIDEGLYGAGADTGWDKISPSDLIDLNDTPSSYDSAKYLKSTASGTEWAEPTLLGLSDTPTTYSGTFGAMLVSTGVATEFTQEGRWLGGSSIPLAVGEVGNYYLAETLEEVYKKNRPDVTHFTARSVIIDMADNYGQEWYVCIRKIEFKLNGVLLDVNGTVGADAYATTNFNGSYLPIYSFDVSLPKTGTWLNNSWLSAIDQDTNQRLICVFDIDQNFDEIVINNGWSDENSGAKNIKIYISTDEITSTVYDQAIANSTLLFDGIIAEHIASDVIDDQIIDIDDALADIAGDTGWDRVLLSASSASLLDLTDTPTTYSGAEGQYLRATVSGTEWSDVSANLVDLNDTPPAYNNGKYLRSVASGTEWSDVSANLVDLNDTPETYDYGKALVSTTSGTEWGTATVTTVTGTILYGTGNPPSAVGLVDGTLFFKYVN